MKGLLAGKMGRTHQLLPEDRRLSYEIYQGKAWQRAQDFLDRLRGIAAENHVNVLSLVINWSLARKCMGQSFVVRKRLLKSKNLPAQCTSRYLAKCTNKLIKLLQNILSQFK